MCSVTYPIHAWGCIHDTNLAFHRKDSFMFILGCDTTLALYFYLSIWSIILPSVGGLLCWRWWLVADPTILSTSKINWNNVKFFNIIVQKHGSTSNIGRNSLPSLVSNRSLIDNSWKSLHSISLLVRNYNDKTLWEPYHWQTFAHKVLPSEQGWKAQLKDVTKRYQLIRD